MTAPTIDKTEQAPASAPTLCLCGCGIPTNPRRDFRQGHDQALVSKFATDFAETGGSLLGFDQLPESWQSADLETRLEQARRAFSDKYSIGLAEKFASAARNRMNKARGKQQRAAKTPATTPKVEVIKGIETNEEGVQTGAPIRFTVGKRSRVYDGLVHGMNQSGKVTSVSYLNSKGDEQVTENFTIVSE